MSLPKLSHHRRKSTDLALAVKAEAASSRNRRPPLSVGWGGTYLPGAGWGSYVGDRNYAAEIGRIDLNPIIRLCLGWYSNAVVQAMFRVGRKLKKGAKKGEYEANLSHDLNAIFRHPCPIYSARETWTKIISDYLIDGNSYLVIVRDNGGRPRELWWVPNQLVEIKTSKDPREPVEHYRVSGQVGGYIDYGPEDVVHIRDYPDEENPILGVGRVMSFLAYVAALAHGGEYTDAALRSGNKGFAVMPPEGDYRGYGVSDDSEMLGHVAKLDRGFARAKGGGSRFMYLNRYMHLAEIGLSPEEMTLDRVLDRPEAYLCAAMGLSPLLFDLPSSSESRTYSNKEEARKAAWEDSLVPMLGVIAEAFQDQVLYRIDPDTGEEEGQYGDAPGLEVWADTSEVPALAENMAEKAEYWISLVDAGLVKREYAASQLDIPEEQVPEEEPTMAVGPDGQPMAPGADEDAFDPAADDPGAFDFEAELKAFDDAEDVLAGLGLTWDMLEAMSDEEVLALGLSDEEFDLLGLQYEDEAEDDDDEGSAPPSPARNGKPVKALAGDCGCGGRGR